MNNEWKVMEKKLIDEGDNGPQGFNSLGLCVG